MNVADDHHIRCPVCRKGPITWQDILDVVRTPAPNNTSTLESESLRSDVDATSDASSEPVRSRLVFRRPGIFQPSTKLNALLNALVELRRTKPDVKSVVFSQFTGMLDLVEVVLEQAEFCYGRLDGSMSQAAREEVLRRFSKDVQPQESRKILTRSNISNNDSSDRPMSVLLVSLRAGGTGLNLTAASHVFLLVSS
jgi:DNA repair protein RAD5